MQRLPVLMASIRQQTMDGELLLEQNDGTRRLYWSQGNLIYVQSDVAGEQFGNYLLRQGILDFRALGELLASEEPSRLGEKVVKEGLMTLQERDLHLESLLEQVMIHALEHEVIKATWIPGAMALKLSEDLQFKLEHRAFIWNTFFEAHNHEAVCDLFFLETGWRWVGRADLLDTVADLPLNPATAYALAFLGFEPISFETFLSLSALEEEEAARLVVTLWALGALTLTQGKLPDVGVPIPPTVPAAPPEPLVFIPAPAPTPSPWDPGPGESLPLAEQPEFLDPEPRRASIQDLRPLPPAAAPPEAPPMDSATRARKLILKAKRLLLQERTGETIRALEQSVQLEPEAGNAFEAWLLLGRLRMANPAWCTRSIDALQTASRLHPRAAEPWAHMGEVYFRKGFKANAAACFQRALELDPSVPIPPDVDLQALGSANASPMGESLFTRFKSILGRPEKP